MAMQLRYFHTCHFPHVHVPDSHDIDFHAECQFEIQISLSIISAFRGLIRRTFFIIIAMPSV